MITQENLKELLNYDLETGNFIWKCESSRNRKKGLIAGTILNSGYRIIRINKKGYIAHRLVWLYVYGKFHNLHIDHIDGDRDNNRLLNLRECNRSENGQNRISNKNSTSKFLGVFWHKINKKWNAQIRVNKKAIYLGQFENEIEAYNAYLIAKKNLHKFNPKPRKADES